MGGHSRVADSSTCCGTCVPLTSSTTRTNSEWSVTPGRPSKTSASLALVSRASETSTPSASPPERPSSRTAQKSSSTDPRTAASSNASDQKRLADVPLPLTSLAECPSPTTASSARVLRTTLSTCAPASACLPLSTSTERWSDSVVAAVPPRLLSEIDVKCEDGSVRKHTIELVEVCSCGVTKCEAKEASEPVAKPQTGNKKNNNKRKGKKKGIVNKAKNAANSAAKTLKKWFG